VEVWDADLIGPGDFLGRVIITGKALLTKLNGKAATYRLGPKDGLSAKALKLVQGKLKLRCSAVPCASSSKSSPEASELQKRAGNHETNLRRLEVVAARGLAKADAFGGKSDPYCVVRWEGKEVHRTKTIKKELNPKWTNETAELPVEAWRRDDDDECENTSERVLVVEVWDEDFLRSGDFLGQVVLTRSDLARLSRNSGEVMEFELAPKEGLSAKALKLVQGKLDLRCNSEFSDER